MSEHLQHFIIKVVACESLEYSGESFMAKTNYEMSALDAYLNRAYKIIIVLPLTGATTSAFVFTIFMILGWWPDISIPVLVIYDAINVAYFSYAMFLLKTCKDDNGTLNPKKLRQGKAFVGFIVVAQWNCITYMIPDREWWAYLFVFIALTIVFFDIKYTSIITGMLLASTFISWFVAGKYMFPGIQVTDRGICYYTVFALGIADMH